jgi:hypothetical protein
MARGTRRDRKKEAFWRRTLQRQAQSSLSVRAWCGQRGVRQSAFYWWRTRLAQRDAAAPPFVPVRVAAESATVAPSGRIEIILAGGRCVQVVGPVDRQALADVLAVLAAQVCAAEAPGC